MQNSAENAFPLEDIPPVTLDAFVTVLLFNK